MLIVNGTEDIEEVLKGYHECERFGRNESPRYGYR